MWLTSSKPRKAVVATVLIVLAGAAIVSFVSAHRYSIREAWVIHTYQALLSVDELSAALNNAVSISQAYVITGDKAEIKNLDTQLASIAALSSRLQVLTLDNSRQKARLAELQPLIEARLDLLRQSIELEDREPGASGLQFELLRKGDSLDDSTQSVIASIREDERQLLLGRTSALSLTENRFVNILLVTFALAAAVLFVLFVVMSSEVSRRGRAEAAAKESEEKFRLLVSSVQDYAILYLDLDGRITTWNLGAERLFGYKGRDILGWPIGSLFQSCDHDTPERHMSAALRDGHAQDDCQQQRRDGTTFWATIDLTLLRNAAGQPHGYTLITRDITERRQQQLEISRREAQLDAFFSNAPVGLAIIGNDLRFQRINGPFSKLNGLPPEQNQGLHVREVVSELAVELEPLLEQVVTTGEPVLNHEVKGPNPANPNSVGWWLKSFFPIAKEDGVVSQIGAVVQDVTALKRAENTVRWLSGRLLQLRDDERRRLARDLHDSLGQVLSAVKMDLSYLSRTTEHLNERAREAIAESKSLVESCIREVRTLSHLLHPPMLDEVGLLPSIRWFVNGFSQRSGVEVQMYLPETMRRLPDELEIALFRALQESLTNVHRHSGSQTAAVSLNVGAGQVQLEVADQGCGIPPQKLTARLEQASIGIGILGMRERIRQLGGQLEISSADVGTTVHVTFLLPEAA
jgi:PAS domain S-box-containing protein